MVWKLTRWALKWIRIVFVLTIAWMFVKAAVFGPESVAPDKPGVTESVLHELTN